MAFTGDISGNPWIVNATDVAAGAVQIWPPPIDTVNARPDSAIHHGLCPNLEIEFSNYTLDTDTCIVQQIAKQTDGVTNRPLWNGNGASDLSTVRSGMLPGPFDGVVIPLGGISNGKVTIYHR